ncbi:type III restriction-modification system endonuclease [Hydrogenimonas urashimensis]|uniref:type III restriction-modification system endonuclease n=1 Tax=Hydrogenimonas urashimensis TaxID=2740515 RepID=UPI0019153093|nr:DEAD/DEAH box helicase family protein [Hydrogenimonas urashimensis]
MKIRFKHQLYQAEAVASVIDCFEGQPRREGVAYRVDPGRTVTIKGQQRIVYDEEIETGFKNHPIELSDSQLLHNIQAVQRRQNLPMDGKLVKTSVSPVNLDVEMETGTGKTYVYTKTIFELYKRYGWSKFIIVVPSVAIREGVAQSFDLTREHFLEEYGLQARHFIYDSKSPQNIKSFSTDGGIQVMIINVQAFNAESNARSKDARRIYMELDEFESRRPIDLIKANRPILILDEPQKMEGKKTVAKLKEFDPLMILRYSATHKTRHNLVHRLDALDAYNKKLVKKIAVKGISVKGLSGTQGYLYLQSIEVAKGRAPVARMEMEIRQKGGIKRVLRRLERGDNLFELSGELEQYRGYVVSEIDALRNSVELTNGVTLSAGEAVGHVDEAMLRRIQIREAIDSHLQKEKELYVKGVKVLTLFFIDEVAKYRFYEEAGEAQKGEYTRIFEEEYKEAIKEIGSLYDPAYLDYLRAIDVEKTHNGYFSIDKKGRLKDPAIKKRGEEAGLSDDVDAYDLILKDKQRLLSFDEPTRFIFSHSALREGWDNPNIFVICTLKHSDNTVARRQEVGRGMRIAVNQKGERMDDPATVHDINVLTVVANESYKDFVAGLQKEIAEAVSDRPQKADAKYFTGKVVKTEEASKVIDECTAKLIERYLIKNDYVDLDGKITKNYHKAKEEGALAPLPEELGPIADGVFLLIDSVYSDALLPDFADEHKVKRNRLNDNIKKREFLSLWEKINRKAVYTVHFDSDELVNNAANALNKELKVAKLAYRLIEGEMKSDLSDEELQRGDGFSVKEQSTVEADRSAHSAVRYDLIGQLAEATKLTRRTVGNILKKISDKTFDKYRQNPEEFIRNAARIINEQKAATVVEHLSYNAIEDRHRLEDIFTLESKTYDTERLQQVRKHVYDYVVTDSKTEKAFAHDLDTANEVVVYAKLPSSFFIPTPVGEYNPDWAIAFQEGSVRHIYFIAETKGSMLTMELRKIEKVKITCARKFFKQITSDKVKYDVINSFDALMEMIR